MEAEVVAIRLVLRILYMTPWHGSRCKHTRLVAFVEHSCFFMII